MKDLFSNDMFWLVVTLIVTLAAVVTLSIVGDATTVSRLITLGVGVLIGAIATHARPRGQ